MEPEPNYKLLLCGLDFSGKTTLIKKLSQGECYFYSTPFVNIERLQFGKNNKQCTVYDVSGQGRHRAQWSFFYSEVDAIIFVVDATDRERLDICRECLFEMARHNALKNRRIPVVILSNKHDVINAVNKENMHDALHFEKLKSENHDIDWRFLETSAFDD